MLTDQEIFDKVCTHMLTQNAKCLADTGECLYRNKEGLSCAIGCLIDPEYYTNEIEHLFVGEVEILDVLLKSGVDANQGSALDMLNDLRKIHDHEPADTWKYKLSELAELYELEWSLEDTSC